MFKVKTINVIKVKVIEKHEGEGNFPTFNKGVEVEVIEDCKFYIGWKKCRIEGTETYVPKTIINDNRLKSEYNPTELVCNVGDEIEIIDIVLGWLYGYCNGQCGWIPAYKCSSDKY